MLTYKHANRRINRQTYKYICNWWATSWLWFKLTVFYFIYKSWYGKLALLWKPQTEAKWRTRFLFFCMPCTVSAPVRSLTSTARRGSFCYTLITIIYAWIDFCKSVIVELKKNDTTITEREEKCWLQRRILFKKKSKERRKENWSLM